MGKEGVSSAGPERGPDYEVKRDEGKRIADALRDEYRERGDPFGWFEICYRQANGDPALIPWGHAVARPELVEWIEKLPAGRRKGRALDIACGLGDNAAALSRAGFAVTAFDISRTCCEWAASRFAGLDIDWQAANLLEPPDAWRAAFDLVNETYTLQTLRPSYRERAIQLLPRFLAPGGTLLIVARGRHVDEPENPPPWPVLRKELAPLERAGLEEASFEDFISRRNGRSIRHFRVEYRAS